MNQKEIEFELKNIKERNKKVEVDKAWEVSLFRKLVVCIFTYFIVGIFLVMIEAKSPWLTAIVPALAYFVSTLTMPLLKKWWVSAFFKK